MHNTVQRLQPNFLLHKPVITASVSRFHRVPKLIFGMFTALIDQRKFPNILKLKLPHTQILRLECQTEDHHCYCTYYFFKIIQTSLLSSVNFIWRTSLIQSQHNRELAESGSALPELPKHIPYIGNKEFRLCYSDR